jgi:hypothetical protein
MSEPLVEASGFETRVRLYEDRLTFETPSLLNRIGLGSTSTETIPLDQVASMKYEETGSVSHGTIKFIPEGYDWTGDNTSYQARFLHSDEDDFEELRDKFHNLQ